MGNFLLIGLGHKARQGKDYCAEYIQKHFSNVHILHFADALYNEARNKNRLRPLVEQVNRGGELYYKLLSQEIQNNGYFTFEFDLYHHSEVPDLHKIFIDRKINIYTGMDEKDPEMLQFWGTKYRRLMCDNNYWVDRTMQDVYNIINSEESGIILIPDTRFKNEFVTIKNNDGYYIDVQRINADGSHYVANDRDPNHPSETDLDHVVEEGLYDYMILAVSGDTGKLEDTIGLIIKGLENNTSSQAA